MPYSLDPTSSTDWWMVGMQQAPLEPNPYHKNVSVSNYSLFHTTNGGKSWTMIAAPWGPGDLSGVGFASSTVGYAWNDSELFVTTDAGRHFKSYVLPQTLQVQGSDSLATGPGGEVWIATYGYSLFASSDYGGDWSAIS